MKEEMHTFLIIVSVLILLTSCRSEKYLLSVDETRKFSVKEVNFTMVRVEGGTFLMGATPEQGLFVEADERPVHLVTVNGFYMAETEVTQELWEAVMDYNPCVIRNAQNPVENITWNDCQVFLERLNRLTGEKFRLPTEAEWEFAARGGNKSKGYKYSGSNNIDEVAWYDKECENHDFVKVFDVHPVKTKKSNELCLYDMSGNVREFCQDCYVEYGEEDADDSDVNFSDCEHVIRGSSWASCPSDCRISVRDPIDLDEHYYTLGLRLAL